MVRPPTGGRSSVSPGPGAASTLGKSRWSGRARTTRSGRGCPPPAPGSPARRHEAAAVELRRAAGRHQLADGRLLPVYPVQEARDVLLQRRGFREVGVQPPGPGRASVHGKPGHRVARAVPTGRSYADLGGSQVGVEIIAQDPQRGSNEQPSPPVPRRKFVVDVPDVLAGPGVVYVPIREVHGDIRNPSMVCFSAAVAQPCRKRAMPSAGRRGMVRAHPVGGD